MIHYIPNIKSTLWTYKRIETFDTLEDLKAFIADQHTRFFGGNRVFLPNQVDLIAQGRDLLTGWKNYCSVVIEGKTIGFCGE